MGKTKINKNLNPVDRQRKLERRKELQRHKKQRTEVRKAMMKNKDTDDLLEQMRRIDETAFNPHNPPALPLIVLDEKRQKLRDQFQRIMFMHKKENNIDEYGKMKSALRNYDFDKMNREDEWRAIRCAAEVQPDQIPLPGGMSIPGAAYTPKDYLMPPQPPNAPTTAIIKPGILKKIDTNKQPPGPPVGIAPMFSDDEGSDAEGSDDEKRGTRVRFVEDEQKESRLKHDAAPRVSQQVSSLAAQLQMPQYVEPMASLSAAMLTGQGIIGVPSLHTQRPQPVYVPPPTNAAVIEAAPQVSRAPTTIGPQVTGGSVQYESKPQLKNIQKQVTKLVPTALHVVRAKPNIGPAVVPNRMVPAAARHKPKATASNFASTSKPKQANVDDAYSQFMNEIHDLL